MSDDSKSLTISVRTVGDGSGARAVTDEILKAKKATEDSSVATGEQEKKILGLNFAMGSQRRVLNELSEALPGLRQVMELALEPEIAIIGLLAAAFIKLKESISETNKEMDATGERLAEHHGDMAKAIAEANREIADSAAEAVSALKEMEHQQDRVKEKVEGNIEAIKRQERAQMELTDAQAALDLARVHAAQKGGEINDAEAARQELAIKQAAEARKNQIQATAEQREVAQRQNELDNLDMERHRAQALIDKEAPGEAYRGAFVKDAPEKQAGLVKDLAAANAALDEQRAEYDRLRAFADENAAENKNGMHTDVPVAVSEGMAKDAKTRLDDAEKARDLIVRHQKQIDDETSRYTAENKGLADARKHVEELNTEIQHLADQVTRLREAAKDDASTRSQLLNMHSRTEALNNPVGSVAAFSEMAKGSGTLAKQSDKLLGEINANTKTTIDTLDHHGATVRDHAQKLRQLESEAAELAKRIDATRMNTPGH